MAINKVIYQGDTLIDLTSDTVTPETLAQGVTAHAKNGEIITGIMEGGGGWDYVATSRTNVNIGMSTFFGARNLRSATIPHSTEVGAESFKQCVDLQYVEIGTPLRGEINLGVRCFEGCTSLENVKFGRCQLVNGSAFEDCTKLKKVYFESAKTINVYAFCECSNLDTVIICGENVCQIALNAFDETPMLTGEGHVYVPSSMYESYRAAYEPTFDDMGAVGFFDIIFRKIEDYPEICG